MSCTITVASCKDKSRCGRGYVWCRQAPHEIYRSRFLVNRLSISRDDRKSSLNHSHETGETVRRSECICIASATYAEGSAARPALSLFSGDICFVKICNPTWAVYFHSRVSARRQRGTPDTIHNASILPGGTNSSPVKLSENLAMAESSRRSDWGEAGSVWRLHAQGVSHLASRSIYLTSRALMKLKISRTSLTLDILAKIIASGSSTPVL